MELIVHCLAWLPFLVVELGVSHDLEAPQRRNDNSMAIAINAIIELFRRKESGYSVIGEILGFSISYNYEMVQVYAYYPFASEEGVYICRRLVKQASLSPDITPDMWWVWHFVWNVYTLWVPELYRRVCEILDSWDPVVEDSQSSTPIE